MPLTPAMIDPKYRLAANVPDMSEPAQPYTAQSRAFIWVLGGLVTAGALAAAAFGLSHKG